VEGNLPGGCPDAKFVAVGICELCPFAPGFTAQFLGYSDPSSFERLTGFFDEVEGFVLVADTYTDGANFREHRYLLFIHRFKFNASNLRTKIQACAEACLPFTTAVNFAVKPHWFVLSAQGDGARAVAL
jgi:hypothetical protein